MNYHEESEKHERSLALIERSIIAVLIVCLLTIVYAKCQAQPTQDRKTFKIENETLKQTIRKLEKIYDGAKFVYSRNKINMNQRINLDVSNKTLYEVMNELFSTLDVKCVWQELNHYIVLSRPNEVDIAPTVRHLKKKQKRAKPFQQWPEKPDTIVFDLNVIL